MKMIDLSHMMNVHTPGWVGYAGNKMYYAQNLQTRNIVAQRIDTAMHVELISMEQCTRLMLKATWAHTRWIFWLDLEL